MKKFTVILIILLYSISTLGIGLKEFYCCGKLKSIKITFAQDETGKCDKGNDKTGCCNSIIHQLKVKDSHLAPSDILSFSKSIGETDFINSTDEIISNIISQDRIPNSIHAPPLLVSTPIYALICNYRI